MSLSLVQNAPLSAQEVIDNLHANVGRRTKREKVKAAAERRLLEIVERAPNLCFAHVRECTHERSCCHMLNEPLFRAIADKVVNLSAETLYPLLDWVETLSLKPAELRDRYLLPLSRLSQHLNPDTREGVLRRIIDIPVGRISVTRKIVPSNAKKKLPTTQKEWNQVVRKHVRRRCRWFYKKCLLVFEDGYTYESDGTHLQYGKGSGKYPACHSATNPALKRRKTKSEIWERDRFEEGLHGYDAYHKMAKTLKLPTKYNTLDKYIDVNWGLRKVAAELLSEVGRGTTLPDEALERFLRKFTDAIQETELDGVRDYDRYLEEFNNEDALQKFLRKQIEAHTDGDKRLALDLEELNDFMGGGVDWEDLEPESRRTIQLLMAKKLRAK